MLESADWKLLNDTGIESNRSTDVRVGLSETQCLSHM